MLHWIAVTCKNAAEAKKIARNLLKKHLVVCTNVVPNLFSQYLWKGKIASSREALLIVKTTQTKVQKAIAAIKEQHSYEMPAIEHWPVKNDAALDRWAARELG